MSINQKILDSRTRFTAINVGLLVFAVIFYLNSFDNTQNHSVEFWKLRTKIDAAISNTEIDFQVKLDNLQMEVDILKEKDRLEKIHQNALNKNNQAKSIRTERNLKKPSS